LKPYLVVGEIDRNVAEDFFDFALEDRHKSEVIISSPGGDIGLMVGMYDVIQKREWNTLGLGVLQSAAAVLFQAGKRRVLGPNSLLLFHEPNKQANGEFSDQDWYLFTKLVELIQIRTGMPQIEVHDLFDNKFISANRAIELGLADAIWEDTDGTGN
jgi:ATP-dependent protease ClpP protease subunit